MLTHFTYYIVLILFYAVLSDQNIIVLYIHGGIPHSQNECKISRIFNHRGYIAYMYINDNSKNINTITHYYVLLICFIITISHHYGR